MYNTAQQWDNRGVANHTQAWHTCRGTAAGCRECFCTCVACRHQEKGQRWLAWCAVLGVLLQQLPVVTLTLLRGGLLAMPVARRLLYLLSHLQRLLRHGGCASAVLLLLPQTPLFSSTACWARACVAAAVTNAVLAMSACIQRA
jgi:hypothetical protein